MNNCDRQVSRIVHVSHTDMDGVSCEILVNQLANYILDDPSQVDSYNCTYNDIDSTLAGIIDLILAGGDSGKVLLLITDIAPSNPDTIQKLAEYGAKSAYDQRSPGLVLLDHHVTARETFAKYPWYRYGDHVCGTLLLYQYMRDVWEYPDIPLAHVGDTAGVVDYRLEKFAEMVDDYDCWKKTLAPQCDDLNSLFQLLGRDRFITRCQRNIAPAYLTDDEQILVDVFADKSRRDAERALENGAMMGFGKDVVGLVVFSSSNQSLLGQMARDKHVDADFIAVVDPIGCKVSLRSLKDGFHVGEFAKQRSQGGGGQEKAAGYEINQEDLMSAIMKLI